MQNSSETLEILPPLKLILSQEVFHAKIYQLLEKVWESLASRADCGQSISELFINAVPGTSLLKILLSYEIKDLKLSYITFPKSGMMHNGNVYELPNLVTHIDEKDYSLLPTPLKSDGDKSGMFKSSEALLKYLDSQVVLPVPIKRIFPKRNPHDISVNYGLSTGMDRSQICAIGDAVIPDIAEYLFLCIKEHLKKLQ